MLWALCALALTMGYALWPVCVPLSPEQVAASASPPHSVSQPQSAPQSGRPPSSVALATAPST